jgi:hypothetical protein
MTDYLSASSRAVETFDGFDETDMGTDQAPMGLGRRAKGRPPETRKGHLSSPPVRKALNPTPEKKIE